MRSPGAERGLRGAPVRTARTCWRLGIAGRAEPGAAGAPTEPGRAAWPERPGADAPAGADRAARPEQLEVAADADGGLPGRAAAGSAQRGRGTATAGDGRRLAGVSSRAARTMLIDTSQNRTAVRSYTCSIANPFYRTPASSVLTHGYDTLRFRRTDV